MKLLNQSLLFISLVMFVIIGVWSVLFYFNLKDEIRDSIDDGLDNNRLLILQKIHSDSSLLSQSEFSGNNFKIEPLSKQNILLKSTVLKDTLMYRQNENDLEPVRILRSDFKHKNKYYRLSVISSLVEEDDLIEDSAWSVFWLFAILIASIFVINNLVFRKIWNPFYKILNRIKTYRIDKNEKEINIKTKTKEFLELQKASNALIAHSKEAYIAQKQFTENASHELQTPIAIIKNKLELLLESENLKTKDASAIADVIKITDRLNKLNKSLLLLAKIENKQFLEQETISINKLVEIILANYEDFIAFKNIEVKFTKTEAFTLKINPSLAEILVSNLIKNAIFHNKKNGFISIAFTKNKLSIYNSGNENPLDEKNIFNRFEKNTNSNKSTGLGLAICKAISESNHLNLSYSYINDNHCFSFSR